MDESVIRDILSLSVAVADSSTNDATETLIASSTSVALPNSIIADEDTFVAFSTSLEVALSVTLIA